MIGEPTTDSKDWIVHIVCNAYEAGFGKGLRGEVVENPYHLLREWEYKAWNKGYEEGKKRRELAE